MSEAKAKSRDVTSWLLLIWLLNKPLLSLLKLLLPYATIVGLAVTAIIIAGYWLPAKKRKPLINRVEFGLLLGGAVMAAGYLVR